VGVPELDDLAAVRDSYDTVAAAYVEQVKAPSELDPLLRAMFAAFAELASGKIADVGCGPGKVAAHLRDLGLDVFGIDLSPRMVELARQAYPHLRFEVGTMTALDLADESLGGIVAMFSTHHLPPDLLPTAFAEFHRTLEPGGRLLLWTHTGDHERKRLTHAYGGLPVSYESHRLPADHLADLLQQAGFAVTARLDEPAPRPNSCFFATKL
jgi:SAM-dependent methyltransferase